MPDLGLFHFLRPAWLIAVPVALLIWWLVRRRLTRKTPGADLIAPHLREALTVNREDRRRFLAVDGVTLSIVRLPPVPA